jgi:hypothetical protein
MAAVMNGRLCEGFRTQAPETLHNLCHQGNVGFLPIVVELRTFAFPPTSGQKRGRSALPSAAWRLLAEPEVQRGQPERLPLGRLLPHAHSFAADAVAGLLCEGAGYERKLRA